MKNYCCTKCGSVDVFIDDRGDQKALMCGDCGKWIKWIGKSEIALVERFINDNKKDSEPNLKDGSVTKELKFVYQNWKGEISVRTIDGNSVNIYYGEVEWHKGQQWLMEAMDLDKQDLRHFALKDIIKYV